MAVLIIRREPLAAATAARVAAADLQPVQLPLFELEDTGVDLSNDDFETVILTSRSAVEVLKSREQAGADFAWLKKIPLMCVGERTAAEASRFGFSDIQESSVDVSELIQKLPAAILSKGSVLYLAGEKRRPELEEFLVGNGIRFEVREIYRIVQQKPAKTVIEQTFNKLNIDSDSAVFLYSEEQARWFWEVITSHKLSELAKDIKVIAISENVAIQSEQFVSSEIHVAKQKDEASMIEMAAKVLIAG